MSSRHRVLFLDHLPAIAQAYERAIKNGLDRPSIVVFDLSERTGREGAIRSAGEKTVTDLIEAARGKNTIPTSVQEFAFRDALETIGKLSTSSKSHIEQATAAGLIPIAVAGDLVTWFTTPRVTPEAAG